MEMPSLLQLLRQLCQMLQGKGMYVGAREAWRGNRLIY